MLYCIWIMFVTELWKNYVPERDITVDEQLVGYNGRTAGRTYEPVQAHETAQIRSKDLLGLQIYYKISLERKNYRSYGQS